MVWMLLLATPCPALGQLESCFQPEELEQHLETCFAWPLQRVCVKSFHMHEDGLMGYAEMVFSQLLKRGTVPDSSSATAYQGQHSPCDGSA